MAKAKTKTKTKTKVRRADRERVDHPAHYGGADDPYEAIKVIEAWGLNFHLGNTVKYIARAERKGATIEDLKKAAWYLQREIARRTKPTNVGITFSADPTLLSDIAGWTNAVPVSSSEQVRHALNKPGRY